MIGLELRRPHHLAYIRRYNVTNTLSSMRPRCTALAILTCDRPARRGSLEVSQTFHYMHRHCPARASDRTSPHFLYPCPSKFGQGQSDCNRRACRAWMGALNPCRNTHQERNDFSYLDDCATVPPMKMAQTSRRANTSSGQRRCELYYSALPHPLTSPTSKLAHNVDHSANYPCGNKSSESAKSKTASTPKPQRRIRKRQKPDKSS